MPDMPQPGSPPPGATPPPPGAASQPPSPGQPPIGSSPATGPTQNLGSAAKGLQAVGAILNGMAMSVALVGAQTPLGQALSKAIVDIGKHVPSGSGSEQGEQNFMKQMMMRSQQMAPHKAALASQGGGAPTPGTQPAPPMAA